MISVLHCWPRTYSERKKRAASGLIADVVLWCLIVCACVLGISIWYGTGAGRFQRLNLTLGDANEVVEGSNVYFTGVHVGEVENITLQPDGVQVELKLLPSTPPLPQALTAHIIFSGLAGTKQIHLWPKNDETLPIRIGHEQVTDIEVAKPVRFRDTLQVNTDIAIALKENADGMSELLSDIYLNPEEPDLPVNPDLVVQKTGEVAQGVKEWSQHFHEFQSERLPTRQIRETTQYLETVGQHTQQFNQQFSAVVAQKPLVSLQAGLKKADVIVEPVHHKATKASESMKQWGDSFHQWGDTFQRWLDSRQL